jgi:nucleoside-diphosphate-sugar epimerase
MNGAAGASAAISTGVSGGLNALKACAKTPSVQRFVFTSSSIAATFAKPNVDYSVTEESFNEDALSRVRDDPQADGLLIYAAVKTATEKAMWEGKQPAFHSQRDRESGVLSSIRSSYTDAS